MSDLNLYPIEDIIKELKTRNITFILAYCDHQKFSTGLINDIVWSVDSGGNLALQATLVQFINRWMDKMVDDSTDPGAGDRKKEEEA